MRISKTNEGFLSILEKIIRSHPLIYIIFRVLIRFTNIFEKDFNGVKLINFKQKVNILDIGASDGIATKFLHNNLNTGTIYCFEPYKKYVDILKKIKIKNLVIKPFAIGNQNSYVTIFFPRYKFLIRFLILLPIRITILNSCVTFYWILNLEKIFQ